MRFIARRITSNNGEPTCRAGATRRDVKQLLGETAYNFALKRAALTIGPKPLETDNSAQRSIEALARRLLHHGQQRAG